MFFSYTEHKSKMRKKPQKTLVSGHLSKGQHTKQVFLYRGNRKGQGGRWCCCSSTRTARPSRSHQGGPGSPQGRRGGLTVRGTDRGRAADESPGRPPGRGGVGPPAQGARERGNASREGAAVPSDAKKHGKRGFYRPDGPGESPPV